MILHASYQDLPVAFGLSAVKAPHILSSYQIQAIASIKTEGLIGDRYVSIDPGGASDELLKPGGVITETNSPTDIQELISKYAFGNVEKK